MGSVFTWLWVLASTLHFPPITLSLQDSFRPTHFTDEKMEARRETPSPPRACQEVDREKRCQSRVVRLFSGLQIIWNQH